MKHNPDRRRFILNIFERLYIEDQYYTAADFVREVIKGFTVTTDDNGKAIYVFDRFNANEAKAKLFGRFKPWQAPSEEEKSLIFGDFILRIFDLTTWPYSGEETAKELLQTAYGWDFVEVLQEIAVVIFSPLPTDNYELFGGEKHNGEVLFDIFLEYEIEAVAHQFIGPQLKALAK